MQPASTGRILEFFDYSILSITNATCGCTVRHHFLYFNDTHRNICLRPVFCHCNIFHLESIAFLYSLILSAINNNFISIILCYGTICFTMALTTFVSQNLGAKQYDRAKKGARFGVLCSIIIAELIGVVIYTAAPVLIAAFNSEPDVVHYGVMQSRTIALFYFLLAFSHCIAAVLRGSGNASVPMIVMLCVWCLFRVSYITVTVHFIPDIRVIFWAYPLTWSISSVIFLALFLRGKWVYGFEKRK